MFKKRETPQAPISSPLANRVRGVTAQPRFGVSAPEPRTYVDTSPQARRERRSAFKQGTLTLEGGERLDVVVKNYSATGARVDFFRQVELTDTVLLTEPSLPLRRRARVIWRTPGAAGLHFISD